MVRGVRLIGSADAMRFGFCAGSLALFTTPGTKGLGSTAASTVCVPGVSPPTVLGLQPVGLNVVPNEIDPFATAT